MSKITMIALQLLAFAMLTNAKNVPTQCSDLPPKQNFNPLAYFSGKWYVTYMYANGVKIPTEYIPCITTKEEPLGKHYFREFISQYQSKFDTFYYAESLISKAEMAHGRAKYNGISRGLGEDGTPMTPFYDVSVTILDTDYTNYAVVQSCTQVGDRTEEAYTIMSRKQDTVIPSQNVEDILQRIGLKLSDFNSIEDVHCKQDPKMNV